MVTEKMLPSSTNLILQRFVLSNMSIPCFAGCRIIPISKCHGMKRGGDVAFASRLCNYPLNAASKSLLLGKFICCFRDAIS